jgi:hypothetical protein
MLFVCRVADPDHRVITQETGLTSYRTGIAKFTDHYRKLPFPRTAALSGLQDNARPLWALRADSSRLGQVAWRCYVIGSRMKLYILGTRARPVSRETFSAVRNISPAELKPQHCMLRFNCESETSGKCLACLRLVAQVTSRRFGCCTREIRKCVIRWEVITFILIISIWRDRILRKLTDPLRCKSSNFGVEFLRIAIYIRKSQN